MNPSKVMFGAEVLLDLTNDTVTSDVLLEGYTAYDQSGTLITGTLVIDPTPTVTVPAAPSERMINKVMFGDMTLIDLSEVTVVPEALANGRTAHDKYGRLITGTLSGTVKRFAFPFSNESTTEKLLVFGESF